MHYPPKFDYDQPSCDTLAGIYLEATDASTEEPIRGDTGLCQGALGPMSPSVEELFGVLVSVHDGISAEERTVSPPNFNGENGTLQG
jgi:hypothetical protein